MRPADGAIVSPVAASAVARLLAVTAGNAADPSTLGRRPMRTRAALRAPAITARQNQPEGVASAHANLWTIFTDLAPFRLSSWAGQHVVKRRLGQQALHISVVAERAAK
jgi:hypothetical protein